VAPASRFEGQAAIELEGAADPGPAEPYSFRLVMQEETRIIKTDDLVRGVCDDVAAGCDAGLISARFHKTVVDMVVSTCRVLAVEEGLDQVALSGGCFQNALLLEGAVQGLASAGLRVYTHSQVPPNDGGLALGQAAVALERKSRCVSPFP
jgi:hydrogenase maturation protein HypF